MLRHLLARTATYLAALGIVVLLEPLASAQLIFPRPSSGVGTASLVRTLLTSVSWQQRAEAAQLLGQTGDPAVIEALSTAAVNDQDRRVRQVASDAIASIRQGVGGGFVGRPAPPNLGFPDPFAPPLRPPTDPAVEMVQSWYQRYLHRSVDLAGVQNFVGLLRQGTPPEELQAAIMGSPEYFRAHGNDPAGFVAGLYADVLGRNPSNTEIRQWLDVLRQSRGDRQRLAGLFLRNAQTELHRDPSYGYYPIR